MDKFEFSEKAKPLKPGTRQTRLPQAGAGKSTSFYSERLLSVYGAGNINCVKYKNTLQKGSARFIIFREGDTWYGTCLEFNIVESGSTPREALLLLLEATDGYLESARKVKARPPILNQKPDPEYEKMWSDLRKEKKPVNVDQVHSFGEFNISRGAVVPA